MTTLPTLVTTRLRLREVSLDDGPALQAIENREEHWLQQAMEPEEFADGTLRVSRYFEHRGPDDARRIFAFVAIEHDTGDLIGQVSLSRSHPAIASVGVGVACHKWRLGYALEMLNRIMQFGFDEVGLNRLTAEVALENTGCLALMERAGLVREGIARECIWAQGRWWTEAQFAILKSDYERLSQRCA